MKKLVYKLHKSGDETVLALADSSVLGKKYSGNGRVLDLITFRQFYDGEAIDEKAAGKLLCNCTSANLVGATSVALAIKHKLAKEEHIVDIGGIAHIQLFKIEEK
ncbi:MAG: DUF424 family protein [Candidatus Micrarchaeia archaeon]